VSAASQVTAYIRRRGPMTSIEVAGGLAWGNTKAFEAIRKARRDDLLKRVGKDDRGRFLFAAVQTADWPALNLEAAE
jgi:hypothetical protein